MFLKWFIDHLASGGRAGVIVPNGVLFGSTNAATGLLVLSLLAVHSRAQLWIIYLVAFGYGLEPARSSESPLRSEYRNSGHPLRERNEPSGRVGTAALAPPEAVMQRRSWINRFSKWSAWGAGRPVRPAAAGCRRS